MTKIYIVDIDGTICRTEKSDYNNSQPIFQRIFVVNELFDQGNKIIYWTARGQNSGKDWKDLTKQQLQTWGCKYHEVRFNKPAYDIWIDDKSINSEIFFNEHINNRS